MNQKIENLLQISVSLTEKQREKSRQLSAGYDEKEQTFEFVIKYSGEQEDLLAYWGRPMVFLYQQYAVAKGTKAEIERLAENENVIWMEKPKVLEYAVTENMRASCISPILPPEGTLTGKGVIIGIVDSGIDIFHPDFQKEDGSTRIIGLWDQTEEGEPPAGYLGGAYYNEASLNEILLNRGQGLTESIPGRDLSGHGTHVAGIAAGNGRASLGKKKGAAPEAELLIVKLGNPSESDFPRTTQVMTGVDFLIRSAVERKMPLVINLSFGNNYGAHDGSSLLETYLNEAAGLGRVTIVTGMGNQGAGRSHTSGNVSAEKEQGFVVGPGEQGFGLQIWKNYVDDIGISVLSPSGEQSPVAAYYAGIREVVLDNTQILITYGGPSPYSVDQEVYVTFLPLRETVTPGIWKISFQANRIIDGSYRMWLPDDGLLSSATGFLRPEPENTLTVPSTAGKVLSVGAYDALTDTAASFSGRGDVLIPFQKPDLVAPGVNIESCAPGGGYTIKSGTSMAAPFVAGSAALLMEWGIIKGNDPFLYGEKSKAYLRKGARKLPGFSIYPNNTVGYGALCLKESFPEEI